MRCFACNKDLEDGTGYDRPTTRYYCSECMEPTNQVILATIEAEESKEDLELFGDEAIPNFILDEDVVYVWEMPKARSTSEDEDNDN